MLIRAPHCYPPRISPHSYLPPHPASHFLLTTHLDVDHALDAVCTAIQPAVLVPPVDEVVLDDVEHDVELEGGGGGEGGEVGRGSEASKLGGADATLRGNTMGRSPYPQVVRSIAMGRVPHPSARPLNVWLKGMPGWHFSYYPIVCPRPPPTPTPSPIPFLPPRRQSLTWLKSTTRWPRVLSFSSRRSRICVCSVQVEEGMGGGWCLELLQQAVKDL